MKIRLSLMLMLLSSTAFAASEVNVAVNGMVCGFCAQGISKKFNKEATVDSVKVSLEKKLVTLQFKDGKNLPDETITSILKDSGYAVTKIDRK